LTGYDPARYGDALGGAYDALYPEAGLDTDATVAMLGELALARPERAVLEFGIGTGRLALRLRRLGLRVSGIEASERMVSQLRGKPGGDAIEVAVGDYVSTHVDGEFSVVALVFNNIFEPRGRSAQLECFRNAARHLGPGGCFVVEAFVLSDAQRSGEWLVSPRYVAPEHVELQLSRYDIATNQIERTLVHLRPEGLDFVTVADTYAAPGELDVMAEVTGFRLAGRFAGWSSEVFTATSAKHVSVYELHRRA
jgi:SAM-dependent methyltransferase